MQWRRPERQGVLHARERRRDFTFGDARFYGSTAATALPAPVVIIEPTPTGAGYWLIGANGTLYPFGDAAPLAAH